MVHTSIQGSVLWSPLADIQANHPDWLNYGSIPRLLGRKSPLVLIKPRRSQVSAGGEGVDRHSPDLISFRPSGRARQVVWSPHASLFSGILMASGSAVPSFFLLIYL